MSEYTDHPRTNVYECVDPGLRFILLSNVILDRIGIKAENDEQTTGPDIAIWPTKPRGYHYKLNKLGLQTSMNPMVCISLEHYIDELPTQQPLTRYAVIYNPFMISEITVVDEAFHPRLSDSRQGKEAAKEALAILSDMAGNAADNILEKMFERRFEEVIGRYILSDLAIKVGDVPLKQFSDSIIEDSLVEHMCREIDIFDDIGKTSSKDDSPAKQTIIADAILNPPKVNRHGKFVQTNIISSAKSAFFTIGIQWGNNVDPGQ